MTRDELLAKCAAAQVAGTVAFNEGRIAAPCMDNTYCELVTGLMIGEGGAEIARAFIKGYTLANLAAPIE